MRENTILTKRWLAPKIYEMEIYAPRVVHNAKPGQFVNVLVHEFGKTIPLTIADFNKKTGVLTQVFQAVGVSTERMAIREEGDVLYSVRGPLGVPSEIERFRGAVVCVAGGVGIAPLYPVVRALYEAGNQVELILGAREEKFLFWEEKIRYYANTVTVCIEKPPFKNKRRVQGLVIPSLEKSFLARRPISHIFGVGPLPMLQAITEVTKSRDAKFVASAVALMIDGTGMCFGCQFQTADRSETFLLCRDGPEVDGNNIDWGMLKTRLNQFRIQEAEAMECFKQTDEHEKFLAQEQAFEGGVR